MTKRFEIDPTNYLRYDPISGSIFRSAYEAPGWWERNIGKEITERLRGYIVVRLCGHVFTVQAVVWRMMTGKWCVNSIDHINGIRDDNRWSNLREATAAQNARNRSIYAKNNTGFVGVHRRGRRWLARIRVGDSHKHLGTFTNVDDAVLARRLAETHYWGDEFRPQAR